MEGETSWMGVHLIGYSSSRPCNCQHVTGRDNGKKPKFCSCISPLHLNSQPPHKCFQLPTSFLCATWTSTSCDISPVCDEITMRRQKAGLWSVSTQSIQPEQTILIYQKVAIKHFMYKLCLWTIEARCRHHYECQYRLSIRRIKCAINSYAWNIASIEINWFHFSWLSLRVRRKKMKEKPNRRKRLTILVQYCIQVKETVGWMGKFERVHLPLFGTCQHNLQTVTQLLHQLPHSQLWDFAIDNG